MDSEKSGIYVQELGAPKGNLVLKTVTRATFAPPGYLLFAREGTLFAQRLDPKDFHMQGDPVPVAEEITVNTDNGRAAFAVSRNGVLVYRRGSGIGSHWQLTWYDREGKRTGPGWASPANTTPDEGYRRMKSRWPCSARVAPLASTPGSWIWGAVFSRERHSTWKQTRFGPV